MKKIITLLLSGGLLAGCATAKFYNVDATGKLTEETGMRIYTPKPYLLVTRNATKDKPLEATIVYLNDLSQPQYLKYKPGIGSNKIAVALTNGIITSYGLEADPKISDLVTAIGGLGTVTGGLAKTFAEAASIKEATAKAKASRLEAADRTVLTAVSKELKSIATELEKDLPAALSKDQRKPIAGFAENLNGAATTLDGPTAVDVPVLGAVVKLLTDDVLKQWGGLSVNSTDANIKKQQAKLPALKEKLEKQIELLKKELGNAQTAAAEAASQPYVELYEIHQAGGKVTLVKLVE